MNRGKKTGKKQLCKAHREYQYLHAINKVIDGEAAPEYATMRWRKLKAIRG